jgi:predicted DCC family thiol-disulfide oxidoreductase YuxK
MAAVPAQLSPPESAHLVLYDGVCGLCNRLLQFLLKHDRRNVFVFASLQSAVGRAMVERFGGNPDDLSSFQVLANYRTNHPQMFSRSSAALFVAGQLGWPWKITAVLRVLPNAILDRLYDVIARNRYRVFGRFEPCLAPRPEFRRRFIEQTGRAR